MSKKRNSDRARSPEELAAIRRYYAREHAKFSEDVKTKVDSRVGKVYRGETKYIDREPKEQRDYVVLRERGNDVTVAKLKSIKTLDENGKNADPALVEINHERYGLPNRTGVDFQRFDKNRMSGKPLDIEDKDVFPEEQERFTLSSHDKHNALVHTGVVPKTRKKKK